MPKPVNKDTQVMHLVSANYRRVRRDTMATVPLRKTPWGAELIEHEKEREQRDRRAMP